MILHIEKLVPDVYTENSRDFQIISRVFDAMYNGVKYDAESITKLVDTKLIREEFLPLLETKLGFQTYIQLNNKEIRYILQAFPYILRNKGSLKAIKQMVQMCLKLYNVNANVDISIADDGSVVNKMNLDKHSILIGIDTVLRSTQILQDLCRYVMPPGFTLYVYFYTELPISEMVEFEDKVQLVYSSSNVASRLKTSTANFRTSTSSNWQSLGQYWGIHTNIPALSIDEVSSQNDETIEEMLLAVNTSGLSQGAVIRTVELKIVDHVNSKLDLNNYDTSTLNYGNCIVVLYDESQNMIKQFYKWVGNKFIVAVDDVRYWVWQTESILPPGYYYRSNTSLMYWYEIPKYRTDIFSKNDFIYLQDANTSSKNGYYRFIPVTTTILKPNYSQDCSYVLAPSIGKFTFYIEKETFFTKTGINTAGTHTVQVETNTTQGIVTRFIRVDGQIKSGLYWNTNTINNFGLTVVEKFESDSGTGVSTDYILTIQIDQDSSAETKSGSWVKISNENIDFVSGPILGVTATNNVVNTVGATLVSNSSINADSVTLTVSSSKITNATVNVNKFRQTFLPNGSYLFTYQSDGWSYKGNIIDMNSIGIHYSGDPDVNDTIQASKLTNTHYLGIYTNMNEVTTKFATPSNGDMVIIGTTEYYYYNSSWHKSKLVNIYQRLADGSLPISIEDDLEEYDIIGAQSSTNKVYFKYTKFVDSETEEVTYKWVQMKCRGSIGTNLVYNPQNYDFINPKNSTHKYFYNGSWQDLNTFIGSSSNFPSSASENDYILMEGVTYYIKLDGALVDITDTAHILEVHKYDRDGREVDV